MSRPLLFVKLLVDLDDNAGTDGTATFTNSEAETFFDCNWVDKFNVHSDVITRHNHFNAFWQFD